MLDRLSEITKKTKNINASGDDYLIEKVDINMIDLDEAQYRKNFSASYMKSLEASILKNGLEQLPHFEKKEDGRYFCVKGNKRTRAYLNLNEQYPSDERWKTIQAAIKTVKPLDGLDKRTTLDIHQINENIERDEGDIFDVAVILSDLKKKLKKDFTKYIPRFDNSSGQVKISRYKSIATCSEEVKSFVRENEISDLATIIQIKKAFSERKGTELQAGLSDGLSINAVLKQLKKDEELRIPASTLGNQEELEIKDKKNASDKKGLKGKSKDIPIEIISCDITGELLTMVDSKGNKHRFVSENSWEGLLNV